MLTIQEITESAQRAIRSNFRVRNQRAFSDKTRQARIVAERKSQIREWILVLRACHNPLSHDHIMSRVTERGQYSGRNLMAHALRTRVILGGAEALRARALAQQGMTAMSTASK